MKWTIAALALLTVAGPAGAGEIFKWVDENGRTHFGEVVPEKYKKSASTMAQQPINTVSGEKLRGPRSGDAQDSAEPKKDEGVKAPPATAAPEPSKSTPFSAEEQCRAQWEQYRASQSCFDKYRLVGGGVRPEAYQNCSSVPQPPACR